MSLLQLDGVGKAFGGLQALAEISLQIQPGEIFGLIGPNGGGKTTLFNLITGVYRPDSGQIVFDQAAIGGHKPAEIAARGIARTFQNIRLFRSMTVEENVMVAGQHISRVGPLSAVLRLPSHERGEQRLRARARVLLDLFGLGELAGDVAQSLPYGSQRRLEIARALMLDPKLLLLDEPAAGMNTREADALKRQIQFLREELRVTVVLVEHNMQVVMSVCDRIHVLDHGRSIAEGEPGAIRRDPRVLAAYLGETPP